MTSYQKERNEEIGKLSYDLSEQMCEAWSTLVAREELRKDSPSAQASATISLIKLAAVSLQVSIVGGLESREARCLMYEEICNMLETVAEDMRQDLDLMRSICLES